MFQQEHARKKYPSDLTDAQWAIVAPLIPPAKSSPRGGRPRQVDMREVLNTFLRLYHLSHTAAIERLIHLKWLDIAGLVEHTSAHIGINGHIEVAHQHLAGTRYGGRDSREFKVTLAR